MGLFRVDDEVTTKSTYNVAKRLRIITSTPLGVVGQADGAAQQPQKDWSGWPRQQRRGYIGAVAKRNVVLEADADGYQPLGCLEKGKTFRRFDMLGVAVRAGKTVSYGSFAALAPDPEILMGRDQRSIKVSTKSGARCHSVGGQGPARLLRVVCHTVQTRQGHPGSG